MASLTELEQWEELIYQLETTDPVKGGDDGISNRQAKQLANRTKYLKKLILDAIGNDTNFAETVTNLLSQKVSIQDLQKGKYIFTTDTGVANAYVCNMNPALTSRAEGQVLRFKVANTNTGASTINDGIGIVPLVGAAHSALQGGELVAGGDALVQWNSTVGTGSYTLLYCSSASMQISPPSRPLHAVNLGQFLASLVSSGGYFKIPVIDSDGIKKTVIIQFGTTTTTSAGVTVTLPTTYPNFHVKTYATHTTAVTPYAMGVSSLQVNSFYSVTAQPTASATIFYLSIGW